MNLTELIQFVHSKDGELHLTTTQTGMLLAEVTYPTVIDGEPTSFIRVFNPDGTPELDQSDFKEEYKDKEMKGDPVLAYVEGWLAKEGVQLIGEVELSDERLKEDIEMATLVRVAKEQYGYNKDEIRVFATTLAPVVTDLEGNDIDEPKEPKSSLDLKEIFEGIPTKLDEEGDTIYQVSSFLELLAVISMDGEYYMNFDSVANHIGEIYGGAQSVEDWLDTTSDLVTSDLGIPAILLNSGLELYKASLGDIFLNTDNLGDKLAELLGESEEFSWDALLVTMTASELTDKHHSLMKATLAIVVGTLFSPEDLVQLVTSQSKKEQGDLSAKEFVTEWYKELLGMAGTWIVSLFTQSMYLALFEYENKLGYDREQLNNDLLIDNGKVLSSLCVRPFLEFLLEGATDECTLSNDFILDVMDELTVYVDQNEQEELSDNLTLWDSLTKLFDEALDNDSEEELEEEEDVAEDTQDFYGEEEELEEDDWETELVADYLADTPIEDLKSWYNISSNGALYSILRKHQVPLQEQKRSNGVADRVAHITGNSELLSSVLADYRKGVKLTTIYATYDLYKNGLYYLLDLYGIPRRMKR